MTACQRFMLVCLCSGALAGSGAIQQWYFYPPGVPPAGLPALAEDSTNIALAGWADAPVDSNAPAFAFGFDEAGHAERESASRGAAHLLFNVSNIYAVVSDAYASATLQLYLLGAADTLPLLTVSVARALGAWAVDSVTWNTAPNGGVAVPGFVGAQELNPNIGIDVTAAMNAELGDAPAQRHGLMLLDASGASPCFFTSKSPVAAYRPYLHVLVPEPVLQSLLLLLCGVIGRARTARSLS